MIFTEKLKQFRYLFFAGTLLLLFLSFSFNIFGVGVNDSWFTSFEQGSEVIVKKTAQCKDGQAYYSGPLIYRNYEQGPPANEGSCSETDLMPYSSQFGLQARAIALFAPDADAKLIKYFKLVELFLALVSAILFATFADKIKKQYGRITATVLVVLVSISPWVVGYAGNLYWVLPLFIAPLILTYCSYDRLKTKSHYAAFYAVISLLFTLKLLDGFEHITTMVISVFAVIAYYEFQSFKTMFKRLLYPALFVGVSSIIAFSTAFAINVIGLNEYYGNTDKSISMIRERAEARSGSISSLTSVQPNVIYALKTTLPDVYDAINYYRDLESMTDNKSNPLLYFMISAMNYALLPAVNFPFEVKGIFGTLLQSVLFIGVMGYVAVRRIKNKDRDRLLVAAGIGLLGALSWLVLMPAHAYPHAFLNGIIFYVPFLLFVYIAFGLFLSELWSKKAKHSAKK